MVAMAPGLAHHAFNSFVSRHADASEAGEGWSDSEIAEALDTSTDTVARTRQQLVEEGFEAVLVRKHLPASARPRLFACGRMMGAGAVGLTESRQGGVHLQSYFLLMLGAAVTADTLDFLFRLRLS
jgi:Homeodomain-like domain